MADSSSKSQIDSEYLTRGGQSLEQKLMLWIMLKKLKYDRQIRSGNQENRCGFVRTRPMSRLIFPNLVCLIRRIKQNIKIFNIHILSY